MDTISLNANLRKPGKAKLLAAQSRLPGVIYGKDFENQVIDLDYQEFRRTFEKAGESTIIQLTFDQKTIPVLVHSVDLHPTRDTFIHVDFHAIQMGVEITANIPVHLEGQAPAIKTGGILVHSKESIEVKCLPKDLIHEITADISGLADFHSSITIKDLDIPSTLTVLDNEDTVIASITAPRLQEEEEGQEAAEESTESSAEKEKSE
jgi:large subunit ribosomal protein L25